MLILRSPFPPAAAATPDAGPGSYTHYRLLVSANNGDVDYTGIRELHLRIVAAGVSVAVGGGGIVSFSGNAINGTPGECFDGIIDPLNGMNVAVASLPFTLGYQFPTAKLIVEYAITAPYSDALPEARPPKDFKLEGSNDGTTWTTLNTRTAQTGWTAGQTRVYAV